MIKINIYIINDDKGFRYNITANHSRSLANTNRIPDLTDGIHTLRVKYDPNFDEKEVPNPAFQVNGYTSWFLNVIYIYIYYILTHIYAYFRYI